MFRKLIAACVGLAMMGMAGTAKATLIGWDYSADFGTDAGTASGSFVYDTVALSFSDVMFTTTGGTVIGAQSFSLVLAFNSSTLQILDPTTGPDFSSDPLLQIVVITDYSDPLAILNVSRFAFCANFSCSGTQGGVFLNSLSSDLSIAAPEPSTLALFATGLALLGFLGWRRRRSAWVRAA